VAELLEAYIRDYLPKKAPQTQYHEKLLYAWMAEELGSFLLADLSPLVLRSWFKSFASRYTPNTIRRYRTSLSAALTVAVQEYEWISTHPLRKVAQLPTPPDRERCLEADELANLLAACQASRNRHLYLAVVLALSTGARKNEIMQRTWEDLNLERGLLSLRQTKNGRRRAVPIVGPGLALLRQHAQRYGHSRWVFPRGDGQRPVYIDYAWVNACTRAGLEDFNFHDLRHMAASYLAMSGASLRDIAEILGHRSLSQTQKYTHLMEPHTRGVLTRMAAQFLEASIAEPAQAPAPMVPASSAETPATPPITPPLSLDLQILAAVRALAPLPASAIQVAGMLLLPIARVRDILQQWAHRGTLVRISKGYYRYRPGGPDTAAHPQTGDVSGPPSPVTPEEPLP
jgi:integrase